MNREYCPYCHKLHEDEALQIKAHEQLRYLVSRDGEAIDELIYLSAIPGKEEPPGPTEPI